MIGGPCFDTMPHIVAYVCTSSPLYQFLYRRLSVLICLETPVSLSSCFCTSLSAAPSPYCIPHTIIECRMTILTSKFSCVAARFFQREDYSICPLAPLFAYLLMCHRVIALSARMSAPSFADSPRCAFTLTKKVAVSAAILFRSISGTSASGAPTNVAFPPSPIHPLTAFNNDWLSHKYSRGNGSSISV